MKSLKSKVILSAVVLIFALVATIGSTFAWFTVSNTVNVSSISLQVQSQESLLIKVAAPTALAADAPNHLTASEYYSLLDEGDILALYASIATAYLQPVTAVQTGYTALDGDILKPLNSVEGNPTRLLGSALDLNLADGSTSVNASGGGVVQMRFWVMSQGSGLKDLYLSDLDVTATDAGLLAMNAVRMSIWAGDYSGSTTSLIYGPAVDYNFAFLEGQAGFFSGSVYTGDTLNGFNAISELVEGYDGLGSSAPNFMTDPSSAVVNETTDVLTVLAQNTPQLITVNLYIEGWDAQTTNDIMLADFDIAFAFSITNHIG